MSLDDAAFEILRKAQQEETKQLEEKKKVSLSFAEKLKRQLVYSLGIIAAGWEEDKPYIDDEKSLVFTTITMKADGTVGYIQAGITFRSRTDPSTLLRFTIFNSKNTEGKYDVRIESSVLIGGLVCFRPEELQNGLLLIIARFLNCLINNTTEK